MSALPHSGLFSTQRTSGVHLPATLGTQDRITLREAPTAGDGENCGGRMLLHHVVSHNRPVVIFTK